LNFTMKWPRNSNGIPFGTIPIGEKIDLGKFDFFNMHLNHKSTREWFGELVEDFYPIQGFAWFEFFQEFLLFSILNPTGDYNLQIWLCDQSDNKVTIEYQHGVNNVTSPQDAPIGKAKIQRSIPGVPSFFIGAKKPEVLDIFDWRNVIWGGLETKDSFDDAGRYKYTGQSLTDIFPIANRFAATEKLHLSIDAFRMIKPLVATNVKSASKPDRNIEPKKLKAEQIVSYAQLKNFVESNEKIFDFEREEFKEKTSLRCDVAYGDPVYYEDAEAIDETTDGLPNTIKAVADKIIYSISKTASGPAGFIRTVFLITRIWP